MAGIEKQKGFIPEERAVQTSDLVKKRSKHMQEDLKKVKQRLRDIVEEGKKLTKQCKELNGFINEKKLIQKKMNSCLEKLEQLIETNEGEKNSQRESSYKIMQTILEALKDSEDKKESLSQIKNKIQSKKVHLTFLKKEWEPLEKQVNAFLESKKQLSKKLLETFVSQLEKTNKALSDHQEENNKEELGSAEESAKFNLKDIAQVLSEFRRELNYLNEIESILKVKRQVPIVTEFSQFINDEQQRFDKRISYDSQASEHSGSGSKPKDAASKEATSQQTSNESHHSQMTHHQHSKEPHQYLLLSSDEVENEKCDSINNRKDCAKKITEIKELLTRFKETQSKYKNDHKEMILRWDEITKPRKEEFERKFQYHSSLLTGFPSLCANVKSLNIYDLRKNSSLIRGNEFMTNVVVNADVQQVYKLGDTFQEKWDKYIKDQSIIFNMQEKNNYIERKNQAINSLNRKNLHQPYKITNENHYNEVRKSLDENIDKIEKAVEEMSTQKRDNSPILNEEDSNLYENAINNFRESYGNYVKIIIKYNKIRQKIEEYHENQLNVLSEKISTIQKQPLLELNSALQAKDTQIESIQIALKTTMRDIQDSEEKMQKTTKKVQTKYSELEQRHKTLNEKCTKIKKSLDGLNNKIILWQKEDEKLKQRIQQCKKEYLELEQESEKLEKAKYVEQLAIGAIDQLNNVEEDHRRLPVFRKFTEGEK